MANYKFVAIEENIGGSWLYNMLGYNNGLLLLPISDIHRLTCDDQRCLLLTGGHYNFRIRHYEVTKKEHPKTYANLSGLCNSSTVYSREFKW